MTLQEKAARLRLLLFDVDGVLTDGTVIMHADGSESKGFDIRDGAAVVWAQREGLLVGLLSARTSGATAQRAAQLAIRLVSQGAANKLTSYEQILRDTGLGDADVAYMGDDLVDLPVLARAG
jgi:3-deoxy-D-manno-octulosonate 8-phosphate phosphatase (KDO 8-P phosphatase)